MPRGFGDGTLDAFIRQSIAKRKADAARREAEAREKEAAEQAMVWTICLPADPWAFKVSVSEDKDNVG